MNTQPIADIMGNAINRLNKVYFNTTSQRGTVLDEHKLKAKSQTKQVLEIFREMNIPMAPHQVWQQMPYNYLIPVTSVRRSMTCLTPVYLTKLDDMVPGQYGRPVHLWNLNTNK